MLKYLLFSFAALSSPLLATSNDSSLGDRIANSPGIAYSWHWPESYGELSSWSKITAYRLASYLTDPMCKAREYVVRSQILNDLPPSTYIKNPIEAICSYVQSMQLIDDSWLNHEKVSFFVEKCFLIAGATTFSALSPITALPAMALRFAASNLESESFIHYKGAASEKNLISKTFTHLQWNICGVKGGYEIEEGGQMPITDYLLPIKENRIAKICEKIRLEDPDVISLNEVFDITDATYLVEALQDKYAHFVIQCGSRTLGLNSGLFFASKFAINEISFTTFPKDTLVDLAKYSEKGFLIVKTYDKTGPIATFISSHLQHSDEPEFPTIDEKMARAKQLDLILQKINSYDDENILISGDLNLTDEEFIEISPELYSQCKKTVTYGFPKNEELYTWLGDSWYVDYGNRDTTFSMLTAKDREIKRKPSHGLNLDHVLVKIKAKKTLSPKISTVLKSTGYDPFKISRDSLSDHMILLSTIKLAR